MIASVDESVGRVLKTLDDLKLSENTLVVFTADNGGVGGYVREGIVKKKDDTTDNAPLRSGKGSLYEGGVRVAYLFRWPGTVQPGTVSDEPINSVDLYPTLLELAGAKPPSGQPLDGVSYASDVAGTEARAGAAVLALPRLPRGRSGHVADEAGGHGPRRRLEADGVLRGRPAGAVQPEGRHRARR